MGVYDPLLFGVAVATAALNVALLTTGARARRDRSERVTRSMTEVVGAVASGVGLIESVKASGGEDDVFTDWVRKLRDLVEARQQASLAGVGLTVGPTLLTALSSAAVLGIGAFQVLNGQISLGTLIAFPRSSWEASWRRSPGSSASPRPSRPWGGTWPAWTTS